MSQIITLERILKEFLSASEKTPALVDFAANHSFVMHYALIDANLEFHMIFESGVVKADMGAPPGESDLTLATKAAIFDKMFTGRIDAVTAAMTGKMKFSGDIHKAMQMQQIQKDIMQIYSEVREKIGDPGDLTKLLPEPVTDTAPMPAISGLQKITSHDEPVLDAGDERDEMTDIVKELYEKNLITATGGNLSVRVKGRENELWITPSGLFKGNLNPNLMVHINLEGEVLDDSDTIPSSEKWVHTEILKVRSDMNAVIHTHSPWSTLLALTETPFLPISAEAAFIGDIPLVPFIMPGTHELAIEVAKAMGEKGVAVLMQNHGLVVVGSTLRRATSTTEVIERYAELILRCLMLGKQPPVLPDEVVKSLRETGQMMA
jgi:ribulose-5-phosphate 4-epimerase/fuculose-1-phosphate aldolase/putative sterol carrier protein